MVALTPPRESVPSWDVLVGRTAELELLRSRVAAAAHGVGGAVLVHGEPGSGKTVLVRQALATAGGTRLLATADHLARHQPLGILLDALESHARATGDQAATDELARVAELRRTRLETAMAGRALLTMLLRLCREAPVVLALDDLDLADPETLQLLERLSPSLPGLPLLLLATVGGHPASPGVNALASTLGRDGALTVLRLQPLDRAETRELCASILGRPPDDEELQRVALAGGNPLLVAQVARSLEHDAPPSARTPGRTSTPGIPHLDRLSARAHELLVTASVLGPSLEARELCQVVGKPMPELLPTLQELLDLGLLDEDADGLLSFRHELVRAAVHRDLPATVRDELHRDAATRLDAAGASAGAVTRHLLQTTLSTADADLVARIARRCQAEAPDRALTLWRRALEITDRGDARHTDAATGIALGELAAGNLAEAEATALALLGAGTPRTGALWTCAATAVLLQGRWAEARALVERAGLEPSLEPDERAELVALAAAAALMGGDVDTAGELARRSEQAARAVRGQAALVRALTTGGCLAHSRADLVEAEKLLREAVELVEQHGLRGSQDLVAHALHARVLCDLDRFPDSGAVLARGRRLAGGSALARSLLDGVEAQQMLARGALEPGEPRDPGAEGRPGHGFWQPLHRSRRALLALHQGGPEAAERWLSGIGVPERSGGFVHGWGWEPRALAAIRRARGDAGSALPILWDGWTAAEERGMTMALPVLGPDLAELAVSLHHERTVQLVAGRLTEVADRNPGVRSLHGLACTARGLADDDPDQLLAGVEAATRSGRMLQAARAGELAAGILVRHGRASRASAVGRQALRDYERTGARYELERAAAALQGLGLRLGMVVAPRPRVGWDALTKTERVVAGFVEQGRTNGEIAEELVLSRRTIESHVSHILAKLGVRNRADLIVAAARRGRLGDTRTDALFELPEEAQ